MHQAIWVDLEDPRAQHNPALPLGTKSNSKKESDDLSPHRILVKIDLLEPFLARLQEFIANPEGEMAWREWVWIHYGASFEKALASSVPDRCFL